MRTWAVGALLMALVGCGGDDDPLAGTTWGAQVNATDVLAVTFKTDGTYVEGTIFSLATGGYGADIEKGNYSISGGRLSVTPSQASCPSHSHTADTSPFHITGDNLTIEEPSGSLVLLRTTVDGTSPGGAVTYGCNEGTTFVPHDLVQLSTIALPVCSDPCSGCVGHVPAPVDCAPPVCTDACRH